MSGVALLVGTSGWQYRDWRGTVYPPKEPVRRWLALYSQMFTTVEVNNSFYRLPTRERFQSWADATPDGFCFAVKASRYLTHIRRLREPAEPVARLLEAAAGLGSKRGPILLQLPPTLQIDCEALDETLRAFPTDVQVAVEFRHESWNVDEVDQILAARDAARVLADNGGHITGHRTSRWAYVRLHHGRANPEPCYGRHALHSWADRLRAHWGENPEGFVYFNNDRHGCAAHNAETRRAFGER